ncbi:TPA: hypothetical protein N0F65_005103 [Lagenidium giganteum]|uniref:CLASP N-terminal domain-containing protein n=1 Tax=Lagenidium giganteum TaxID=4803 RepID=A0AAV2Z7A7_9STRA|nr:TPA: hypothetical protein N0F65_005103 [Lagenidium giganteum]
MTRHMDDAPASVIMTAADGDTDASVAAFAIATRYCTSTTRSSTDRRSAMENALHYFDELKDKYMHQAQQVIEDWDYQDFSPDKRAALLDGEVSADLDDDRNPEPNAHGHIAAPDTLCWVGLTADAELDNCDYGVNVSKNQELPYEAKIVILTTPNGGIQGLPDTDALKRFLQKAVGLDATKVTDALAQRLQQSSWQVRSKAMVVMQLLLESKNVSQRYLQAFIAHPQLVHLVDAIRCGDRNHVARENGRKLLSLIRSNGTNTMLLDKQPVSPKPHVRHAQMPHEPKTKAVDGHNKTRAPITKRSVPSLQIKSTPSTKQIEPMRASPRVAQAALASWKRRSTRNMAEMSDETLAPNPMPYQKAGSNDGMVAASSPAIVTTSGGGSSRYESGHITGFSFITPAPTPPSEPVATRPKRSSQVLWLKLNFTVNTAKLQSLKRNKYQHLQEEALLKARGLLQNWENGEIVLTEDLLRSAASDEEAQELMQYTPEALAVRFSLRNDPRVVQAIKDLWSVDVPRDELGCIDRHGYIDIFRRIAKSLDIKAYRQHRLRQTIEQDWIRDSRGESKLGFASFFDSMFELVDLWCETIHAEDYARFLTNLRDRITRNRSSRRVLRKLTSVVAMSSAAQGPPPVVVAQEEQPSEEVTGPATTVDAPNEAARQMDHGHDEHEQEEEEDTDDSDDDDDDTGEDAGPPRCHR